MEYARVSYNDGNGQEEKRGGASYGGDAQQEVVTSAPQGDSTEGGGGKVGPIKKEGFVYFIETQDGEFVKIGYSTRPYRRLKQLGTGPGKHALRIIGWIPGTIQTERWMQEKFSADWDNGEWFRSSPSMRQFIVAIGLIEAKREAVTPTRHPPKPSIQDGSIQGDSIGSQMVAKRYAKMTPGQRSAAAKNASDKRWAEVKRRAMSGLSGPE